MQIRIIQNDILVGNRVYSSGDVVDLEVTQEQKTRLVKDRAAIWYDPPIVETATIETKEKAIKPKAKPKT